MRKLDYILFFVLPALRTAAAMLAAKDDNDTGADDEAAAAINYALERLEKYQKTK